MKYRKRLLVGNSRIEKLKEILQAIAQRYWFEIERIGTDGDYLHLFLGAAARYSPASIAGSIKSISAKEMFKSFPELRNILWGAEFWEDGFYVRSVGDEVTEDVIRKYIDKQGRHTGEKLKQLTFFELWK